MTLDASGNLGLGVTPSAWQSTNRAIQIGQRTFISNNSDGSYSNFGNNAYFDGTDWRYLNTASTGILQVNGNNFYWQQATSGTAGNAISFTQAMTLDASGTLFIGKTNSAISNTTGISLGSGGIFAHSSSGNGYIDLGATRASVAANIGGVVQFRAVYRNSDSDNTTIAFIKGMREDATNNLWRSYLSFETTNTDGFTISEKMRITSGGNVGIGTTSPGTSKLYVLGDATNYGITSEAPSGYGKLILKQTSGQAWSIGLTSNDLFFYYGGTSAGTRVTFANGGNVGIGTTSPSGRLHIDPADNEIGLNVSTSSLTGSNAQSLIDLAQTWNTTGNPTAIKLNITNTASGTGADLMELQVGGTNQFRVTKGGAIETDNPTTGTKKPWKLGSVMASSMAYDATRYIEVEVDGTLYYLALSTLAEPAPSPEDRQASGPSYSVQKDRPIIKPETDKIKSLEKEIAELKQLIKSIQK